MMMSDASNTCSSDIGLTTIVPAGVCLCAASASAAGRATGTELQKLATCCRIG